MQLTFQHDCPPKDSLGEGTGCPIPDREVLFSSAQTGHLNEYVVPDIRCLHTNNKLKLVAVDRNRDI